MSARNIDANSKLTMAYELPVGMADGIALRDQDSTRVDAPRSILQSAMAELGEGGIEEVVALFNEHFKFNDHAMIRSVQDDFATRGRTNQHRLD